MKAIKLEIQDFINHERIVHEYRVGSYEEFFESIAKSHNVPVQQLILKESVTNSIIVNENDLIKNQRNLIIDSPNPLFHESQSIVQSIVMQHQKSSSPIRMVDKEVQCDPEQKQIIQFQPKLLSNEKSVASTYQMEINQEEMKIKLKDFISEIKMQYFEVLAMNEDSNSRQQSEFIDKLRRNRIQQLKQYDKEIEEIQNQIAQQTERLMDVQFTSEEQIKEIRYIMDAKIELEKNLSIKEGKRKELIQSLNRPMTEQEIRDQFYQMKWKLLKKIELFKKKLAQSNIQDDEFTEKLSQIQQKAELLNKQFGTEIILKGLQR